MKTIMLAAAMAAGLAFGAQAETFTFTSSGTGTASVVTPGPNGTVRAAGVSANKGVTMYGARAMATESTCAGWPSQPGDLFASHGMCTFSDASGAGYIRFGCNPAKEANEENCVGGLWGTAGAYKDRSGSMAWHAKGNGGSGTSVGAGQWGD
jgi:hypothetical protein